MASTSLISWPFLLKAGRPRCPETDPGRGGVATGRTGMRVYAATNVEVTMPRWNRWCSGKPPHDDSLEERLAFMAWVRATVRAPLRRRPSSGG